MPGLAMGLGLISPRRSGGGAARTIDFITGNGASAATISPTGIQTGDLVLGIAAKTTVTAPTHDVTGGALIGSWSSNGSSAIAFWKWAESATPAFGTHTGANRVQYWAYRFSEQIENPIGDFDRNAANLSTNMGWVGLTLEKQISHVITLGFRAADETITSRTGAVAVPGTAGVSARFRPMRSDGAVSSWPLENVAQAVSGYHQSIAIEIGF